MKPLALPLLIAALFLGGCYNPKYPGDAPGTERSQAPQSANTVTNVYRTGPGTIETVNRSPSPSAVAGATNVRNDEVLLRMDDGTRQIILMPAGSTSFNAGDRVEVTSDRRIERR
jgi:PBP1b-binding outer membrane lipoprotein LpoB